MPVRTATTIPILVAIAVIALNVNPWLASAEWPPSGRPLCTAPGDQLGPVIAPDGAGGAIVAWQDRRSQPVNIFAQHVLVSGQVDANWAVNGQALMANPLVIASVTEGQEVPAIVSDGAGGAIITWPDGRSDLTGLDIFAQHILASGTVDRAWPANGTVVCAAGGSQNSPVIISDGAGGAIISWTDGRLGTTVNDIDIYAQHVLASGLVDPVWPTNGAPVCTAPKAQVSPAIVDDGAHGILVTWSDLRSGNPGIDIYSQHVLSSGVVDPAWPADGFALCTAPGTQAAPRIISDGISGAIVTWTDSRDGTNQVFAQRVLISAAIAPGWPFNGRHVSVGGTDEVLPVLVSDGASGAIVAWGGGSSGHHNTRAQHLLASGVLDAAWPAGGTAVAFASSEETSQVITSDGAGGAIIAWQRGFDIFAHHVLASGGLDPSYPVNGRPVAAFPDLQSNPAIVASGPGGAIVTWRDRRNGISFDIYALQVLEAGTTDVSPGTGAHGIAFARPNPNPAHGAVDLRYSLRHAAPVKLDIYDVRGRCVRRLASGTQAAGAQAIAWDLRDDDGRTVDAGLYFARLEVEGNVLTQKLATLK